MTDQKNPTDKKEKSLANKVIELIIKDCKLVHNQQKEPYAIVNNAGVRRVYGITSKSFMDWVASRYYAAKKSALSARPTGGVVDGSVVGGLGVMDTQHLRHDAADLCGGVKLALALSAFGGKVAHQVFIGIAKQVVTICTVLGEIQRRVFKDGDQVGKAFNLFLAVTQFGWIVKVRHIRELIGLCQWPQNLLVNLVANISRSLQSHHVGKAGTLGNSYRSIGLTGVLVADVLNEQKHQHVVFVLAGIHAAAQFVTGLPKG